jgi:hypothetical protein
MNSNLSVCSDSSLHPRVKEIQERSLKFWGCLPDFKAEAPTNAGATPKHAQWSGVEVHQAGMHVFWRPSACCVPQRRIDLPTARFT